MHGLHHLELVQPAMRDLTLEEWARHYADDIPACAESGVRYDTHKTHATAAVNQPGTAEHDPAGGDRRTFTKCGIMPSAGTAEDADSHLESFARWSGTAVNITPSDDFS
jgi:hypothetical protein